MIRFEHVSKTFKSKKNIVEAVKDVSFEVKKGEIFGIIGFSGAGKSTLVRCINLLEVPTEGNVYLGDINLTSISEKELRRCRQKIGMIFQQFNLLSQKNVIENICYPLLVAGTKKKDAVKRAKELLKLVDLTDKEKAYPAQLSGGQKQRVAIARALATSPEVLLCDEATSALDPITTRSILELLKEINEKLNVTIVVITHEMKVVEQICNRVAVMSDGRIEEIGTVKDVFVNPQSDTARRLILPDKEISDIKSEGEVLRIVFDGQSSNEPIISDLSVKYNVMINILGANTENIGGRAFGQMLIELPKDEEKVKLIKDYLTQKEIHFEKGGR